MTATQALGDALIAAFFLGLFAVMARIMGGRVAVGIFAVSAAVSAFLVLAVFLATGALA